MIEVRDVTKFYGTKKALDSLDMTVPAGSVYGLVGPNGAGKTTILNHIAGSLRATSGEVLVNGEKVYENPRVKANIAVIPSDFYFYSQATVGDMMDLHSSVYPRFDKGRFQELTPLFRLDPKAKVRSLSKGMTKQLAFWLALSQRPQVLLLDEPLDGLDPAARRTVWSVVMEEVAENGMTVLTSSHNLRELTDVCDWVGIMTEGRMHLERSLTELQDNFVKVQVAFEDDVFRGSDALNILHLETQGRLFTAVVRGNAEEVERVYDSLGAVFVNVLPLSLEEIFIYELGGGDYASQIFD